MDEGSGEEKNEAASELQTEEIQGLNRRIAIHETMIVALMLAVMGGFLDAYTYLVRGGVFANAQTGNMVLFAISAAKGRFESIYIYVIPIFMYFIGVFITEIMRRKVSGKRFADYAQIILMIELLLLLGIGFIPVGVPDAVVNSTISFVCGMQTSCFKKVGEMPYASTMCTGNLRYAAEHFAAGIVDKEPAAGKKSWNYILIILCFVGGAVVGAFLTDVFSVWSVWFCCGVILSVYAVYLITHLIIRRKDKKLLGK